MQLQEIFPVEFSSLVRKHARRIEHVLATYDVTIFMARKAICLYKAFLENNELKFEHHSLVLASRVITLNILPMLKGKKIAVIDDVVVKGKAIKYVMDCLAQAGMTADVFVMACEENSEDQKAINPYIISSPQYMVKEDINRFSNFITKYIHLTGIPYNIDFPIYKMCFSSEEEIRRFFDENHCQNLTDGIMRKYGIERYTLNFDEESLACSKLLGIEKKTISKIRFYYKKIDDNKAKDGQDMDDDRKKDKEMIPVVVVPLVLLPELKNDFLKTQYEKVIGDTLGDLIYNQNHCFEFENRFKIIQYALSECLLINFAKQNHIRHIRKDSWNEKVIFSRQIDNSILCEELYSSAMDRIFKADVAFYDNRSLNEYLNVFYDFLLNFEGDYPCMYRDGFGNPIKERIIDKSSILDYYNNRGFCIEDSQISCFLDLVIDKGLLVPSVVHKYDSYTVRVYKLGEIYKLHKEGIELFHYMLYQYFDLQKGQALDRTELEKLCVLFLKKTTYGSGLFKECDKFEDDCFSIGFSKFGPRVSDSKKPYTVHYFSALSAIMEDEDKISRTTKYIINPAIPPKKDSWRDEAYYFAYNYSLLKSKYDKTLNKSEPLARTYNDFITLLAIGAEKKSYIYALIAELLFFVRNVDERKSLKDIIIDLDHYEYTKQGKLIKYCGVMDAINSGVWKYLCYQDHELVKRVFRTLLKADMGLHPLHLEYSINVGNVDTNPLHDVYIKECGELLLEIAFTFNSIIKVAGERLDYPDNRCKQLRYLKNAENSRMRSKYTSEKIAALNDDQIVDYLLDLKERCRYQIDKCDLCVEQVSLQYSEIKDDIRIVYDPDHLIPNLTTDRVFALNNKESELVNCAILRDTGRTVSEIALSYQGNLKKDCRIVLLTISMDKQYHGAIINGNQIGGSYLLACLDEILPNMVAPLSNGIYCISVYESESDPILNKQGMTLLKSGKGTTYKYGLYQLQLDVRNISEDIIVDPSCSPIRNEDYFTIITKAEIRIVFLLKMSSVIRRQLADNRNIPEAVAKWRQYGASAEEDLRKLYQIKGTIRPDIPFSKEEIKQYLTTFDEIDANIDCGKYGYI